MQHRFPTWMSRTLAYREERPPPAVHEDKDGSVGPLYGREGFIHPNGHTTHQLISYLSSNKTIIYQMQNASV